MFRFNFSRLNIFKNLQARLLTSAIVLPIFIFSIFVGGVLLDSLIMLIAMLAVGEANCMMSKIDSSKNFFFKAKIFRFCSIFFIFIPCVCFILLRYNEHGILLIAWLSTIVISTDIFAYFGGQIFKGPLLCPKVSPGKTLSGSFSGFFASLLFSFLFFFFLKNFISLYKFLLVSIFSSILAQIGDLLESYCKRKAKVKDSGVILFGHGGILDRMDSFILSTPFFFIVTSFF